MYNKVQLIGNLGADPEVKTSAGGATFGKFSLATSESFKDKEGQKQTRTEWHRVTCFGRLAEIVGEHLTKGRQVFVEGSLRTDKYTDKDGVERYSTGVIANTIKFLGGGGKVEAEAEAGAAGADGGQPEYHDDIPF